MVVNMFLPNAKKFQLNYFYKFDLSVTLYFQIFGGLAM